MRDVRVASVQFEHAARDKKANIAKIKGFVERIFVGDRIGKTTGRQIANLERQP